MDGIQFFDPDQDFVVAWRKLPHWAQAGAVSFITWRTHDSLPTSVQDRITAERRTLLQDHGLDPGTDSKEALASLDAISRGRIRWSLFRIWDDHLDKGHGACVLRDPCFQKLVSDSLLHFDGDRYVMLDFVIMPNHVHLLVAFRDDDLLWTQCTSWKRYTARQINRSLGQRGEFWQVDQFDHLVRSPEQFEHYRRYIAENPRRAGVPEGSSYYYSKEQ